MVNLEHNLTVDDLIVEYMIFKLEHGYDTQFSTSEFMDFLCYFEKKMPVQDSLYDGEKLFQRFFERKKKHDWNITENYETREKIIKPHMEMEYSQKDNDYIVRPNYKFSHFDRSIINTYFMYDKRPDNIRNIIGEYLSRYPKRKIDESVKVEKEDLIIGKYLSAEIIEHIWKSYIYEKIKNQMWPEQCNDINKYLLQMDLAEIIGVTSIKKELIELYNTFSKRLSILYNQDRNLKVSSYDNVYLARSNYDILIQDYEKTMSIAFGPYKKSLEFDLSKSTFNESHEIGGIYNWDDDIDISTTTVPIENEKVKKIVRNIEKNNHKI